jgi:hypothetical protein
MTNVEETHSESVRVEPVTASVAPLATPVISEAPSNLRWGAIVGGTVAALGVASLLYSLGLALGLSAIDPQDPGSLRPSGIFTGVWALVVSLVALFVGGYVAARGASALTRMAGALHGLVVWGLTVVAGMWLIGTVASGLVSGAVTVSRLDRQALMDAITANTALERGDTDAVAAGTQNRMDQARERARRRSAETRRDALSAAEDTGKAFWGVFGALFLGMIASIGGALVGSASRGRKLPQAVVRDTPPRVEHRAVYP